MALITGNLNTLAGGIPTLARLWFHLSRPGWSPLTGDIYAPEFVEAVGDPVTGAFSIDLTRTDEIEGDVAYYAVLKWRDIDGQEKARTLGNFGVEGAGPFELADLLVTGPFDPVPEDLLALLIAAEAAAAASADTAEAVAESMNIPRTRAELVTWVASNTPVNNLTYFAGGRSYIGRTGATTLPGLPGLEPLWPYHIEQWGVVGDTSDGGAAINAAITWISANGGGDLNFDLGRYGTSVTIVAKDGVKLRGQGQGQYPLPGSISDAAFLASERTEILALNAMALTVDFSATPDDTLSMASVALTDFAINCNELADKGLNITTVKNSYFDGIMIFRPVVLGASIGVLPIGDAPTLNNADTQFNGFGVVKGITAWCGATGTAEGIHINGTTIANVNQNTYGLFKTVTNNVPGIRVNNSDNDVMLNLHSFRFVPGPGIVLNGDANSALTCRNIVIVRAEVANGWVLAETGALNNRILSLSTTNGSTRPVIETGAGLVYSLDTGATEQWSSVTSRQAWGTSAAWVNGANPAAMEWFARLTGATTGKTRMAALETWLRGGPGAGTHDGEMRFVTLNNDVENTPLILTADSITLGVGSQAIFGILSASPTVDMPSIPATTTTSFDATITGAKLGDTLSYYVPSNFPTSLWIVRASVHSANTVRFFIHNPTGAAVDPPSGAWGLTVIRRS